MKLNENRFMFLSEVFYSADDEFCTRLKSRVKCTFRSKG